ncbi:MAG TPA: hypothetical protein VFR86_10275, partial [Burkholderiaceae bacterium]|nr:hypothetical protein [Burkholderiaceae bacterium]
MAREQGQLVQCFEWVRVEVKRKVGHEVSRDPNLALPKEAAAGCRPAKEAFRVSFDRSRALRGGVWSTTIIPGGVLLTLNRRDRPSLSHRQIDWAETSICRRSRRSAHRAEQIAGLVCIESAWGLQTSNRNPSLLEQFALVEIGDCSTHG